MNNNIDPSSLPKKQKRPWDLLNKTMTDGIDFDENRDTEDWRDELRPSSQSSSLKKPTNGLLETIKKNQKQLLMSFLAFALILGGYAATIPSSFYSTLHLYAPEKTDSIGTRLSLFTQKLEYASFPVDYKTPMSLISRRLREDTVRDWVIKKMEADPKNTDKISRNAVSVETNYVPNQEILAIEGYANSPELAVLATNYYWDFLISDVRELEEEQQTKIRKWFDLTNKSLNEQIIDTMKQLEATTPRTFQKSGVFKLQESLGDVFSNFEMKKSTLEKQLLELRSLSSRSDFVGLSDSIDSEVASQLKIYNQLVAQKEVVDPARVQQGRMSVIDTISKRIQEIQYELNSISSSQKTAQGQMVDINAKDNQIKVASEQEMDLRSQLMTLRAQKSDLIKFKSQIEMESSIRSAQFKPIRMPAPNPSSIRPLPVVKYGLAFFIALILALSTVLTYQFYLNLRKQ